MKSIGTPHLVTANTAASGGQIPFPKGYVNPESLSSAGPNQIYEGIGITTTAGVRQIWFVADSDADAKDFCGRGGFALVGRATLHDVEKSEREAFTVNEVREKLQLSRSSVYRLIASGRLSQLRGVGAVRITRKSLNQFLSSSK